MQKNSPVFQQAWSLKYRSPQFDISYARLRCYENGDHLLCSIAVMLLAAIHWNRTNMGIFNFIIQQYDIFTTYPDIIICDQITTTLLQNP